MPLFCVVFLHPYTNITISKKLVHDLFIVVYLVVRHWFLDPHNCPIVVLYEIITFQNDYNSKKFFLFVCFLH